MMGSRTPSPRRVLSGVAAVLLVLCLAPPRFTRWVEWFRGPLVAVVTPAARPAVLLSSWLRPGNTPADRDAAVTRDEALRQRDEFESLYLRALNEIEALRANIRDLQGGREFAADPSCEPFVAPRIGSDLNAGTIEVRGGAGDHITIGSVAVGASSQQLIGVVSEVGRLTTTVRVITRLTGQRAMIGSLLIPPGVSDSESILTAPRCSLTPTGDGTLTGEVGVQSPDDDSITVGMLARVDNDLSWPVCAWRLVIGRVVDVQRTDHPLFRRVVVQPEVDPLHAPSVVLRIPRSDAGSGGAGGGGIGAGGAGVER